MAETQLTTSLARRTAGTTAEHSCETLTRERLVDLTASLESVLSERYRLILAHDSLETESATRAGQVRELLEAVSERHNAVLSRLEALFPPEGSLLPGLAD
jgi:hypothetical protein